MPTTTRRIGAFGTASRALGGLGLLFLAVADGRSWGLAWYDAALGLVGFPSVMVAAGLAARRYKSGPVQLTGPIAIGLNLAVIAALALNAYTATATALFYGATLLVAASRAQPGCEATVLSNWLLRRDDQLGCPAFTPIDAVEARLTARQPSRTSVPAEPTRQPSTAMAAESEAVRQPDAASTEERRAGSLRSFGLLHLVACLGAGAVVVAAIYLIEWLT